MSWVSNPSRIFQSRVLSSFGEAPHAESCVLDQDVIVSPGGTVGRRTGRPGVPEGNGGRRDVTRHWRLAPRGLLPDPNRKTF